MRRRSIDAGFTLVEMLVIAPIIILMIGIFISSIVTMTGDVMSTRASNSQSYDIQNALDRIEKDVKNSGGFLSTNNVAIKSPQGKNNDTTKFVNVEGSKELLILNAYATTNNPLGDEQPEIMRIANQPYACDSDQLRNNPPVTYNIVYFVDGDDGDDTLWRRVIMPANYENVGCSDGAIATPWQRASCAASQTDAFCKAKDERIVDHIDEEGFNVAYFALTNSTQENTIAANINYSEEARQAALATINSVQITIRTTTNTAGRIIPQSGSIRASSENDNTDTTADKYWNEFSLQNGWTFYGGEYHTAGYIKLSSGMVVLKGLIKKSSNSLITCTNTIATLPEGYRPSERIIFLTTSTNAAFNANAYGRVDVFPDGNVSACTGYTGYISLDTIRFMPTDDKSGDPYTFTSFSSFPTSGGCTSPWRAYGSATITPSYTVDSEDRTIVQGFVTGGTTTDNCVITSLPSNLSPSKYMHIANNNDNTTGNLIGISNTGQIRAKGGPASYNVGMQAIFYPSTYSKWSNLTYSDPWSSLDTVSYAPAQYTKGSDGLVSLRGMVRNGSIGSTIATLPAGFRPAKRILSATTSGGAVGAHSRVDIDTSGNIIAVSGSNSWYSLDGITFYAEQ